MSALTDRIDRFVRWFFNSSPTTMAIEVDESGRAERAKRRHVGKAPAPPKRRGIRRHRSLHGERARA